MSTEDFVPEKLESVLIKTTCSKSGGFNRYTKLPERSIFDNVCYVLSDTLEVKVKESGLLFNRETPWERRPVYFGLFKGFLLIYMKSNSGYALKVPTAHGLRFEGTRVKGRGKKLLYKAVVKIIYNFGQIHLRFKEGDDIRAWRTLLLAAHQFPNTLNSISIDACRKFHWNDASSIVSIHSLQKTPGSGILKNIKYKGDAFTVTRRHVDKETSEREVEEPQEIRELVEDEGVRESSNIGDESCINVEQEDENNLADSKLNSSENDSLFRTCPDILETSYSDCSRKYGEFNADAVVLSSVVDPETSVNPVVCANGEKREFSYVTFIVVSIIHLASEVLDDEHNTSAPQAVILNKCDISIDSAATTVGVRTPVK